MGYLNIARPLTDSLYKTEPTIISWDARKAKAFQCLKSALAKLPVLAAPNSSKGFLIHCDASDRDLGVVLCQEDIDGHEWQLSMSGRWA